MCGAVISDIHCGGNPQYEQKDDGGKRFINEFGNILVEG